MPEAITNTSPALYLYRIGVLDILPQLFERIWIPNAAVLELKEGRQRCATARASIAIAIRPATARVIATRPAIVRAIARVCRIFRYWVLEIGDWRHLRLRAVQVLEIAWAVSPDRKVQ